MHKLSHRNCNELNEKGHFKKSLLTTIFRRLMFSMKVLMMKAVLGEMNIKSLGFIFPLVNLLVLGLLWESDCCFLKKYFKIC